MNYEIVSKQARFIWGCRDLKHARKTLKHVRDTLGYKDAILHAYK